MKKNAVVLLSGGIDSATTLAIAVDLGFEVYTMSFRYGQRHAVELDAAQKLANIYSVEKHAVMDVDLNFIGGSALTANIKIPKHNNVKHFSDNHIPITYVPARNTIFLSFALAWAEVLKTYDIFIGVNAVDYSGYPDCRPQYIKAYENMANLATCTGIAGNHLTIHTPLINLSKAEIIKTGMALNVNYSITHSCYDPFPDGKACGTCDSCIIRINGFKDAAIPDPTIYG